MRKTADKATSLSVCRGVSRRRLCDDRRKLADYVPSLLLASRRAALSTRRNGNLWWLYGVFAISFLGVCCSLEGLCHHFLGAAWAWLVVVFDVRRMNEAIRIKVGQLRDYHDRGLDVLALLAWNDYLCQARDFIDGSLLIILDNLDCVRYNSLTGKLLKLISPDKADNIMIVIIKYDIISLNRN